jgi:hypothetical protein
LSECLAKISMSSLRTQIGILSHLKTSPTSRREPLVVPLIRMAVLEVLKVFIFRELKPQWRRALKVLVNLQAKKQLLRNHRPGSDQCRIALWTTQR